MMMMMMITFAMFLVIFFYFFELKCLAISAYELCLCIRVAFRTTPLDSTGVPHILEHLTLCGSEKFPVRDPFFKMYARSLATFMNAFTGLSPFK